jgi:hypothetical protein
VRKDGGMAAAGARSKALVWITSEKRRKEGRLDCADVRVRWRRERFVQDVAQQSFDRAICRLEGVAADQHLKSQHPH